MNCSHFSSNCSQYGTVSKNRIQSTIQSPPNASVNLKNCQFCQKCQHSNSVLTTESSPPVCTGVTDVETWPILWPTNESWNVYNHKNTGSLWIWCFLLSQPPKCLMDVVLWHFLIVKACNIKYSNCEKYRYEGTVCITCNMYFCHSGKIRGTDY